MTNTPLKIAIIQSGQRSYEIERFLGFWPGKLSKIISGIIDPSIEERIAIAKTLKQSIDEIFPGDLSYSQDDKGAY